MSKRFYFFIYLERGREGEREGDKHQCVVASHSSPTGDHAHNPGMCPDWVLNWQPFGSQDSTQCTGPNQPGLNKIILIGACEQTEFYLCPSLVLSHINPVLGPPWDQVSLGSTECWQLNGYASADTVNLEERTLSVQRWLFAYLPWCLCWLK